MNINRQYITKINFTDKNNVARIKYIVIHYFGGLSTALQLAEYWAREYAGASAHYAIGHEGEIFQIVEDDDVAWHCGAKSYKHAACRNTNSIGIEMAVKKKDSSTKLKDKDGNQLYIKNKKGEYVEATLADYYTADKFYKKLENIEYKYTGWQTIDGRTYYFDKNGNPVTGEQIIQGAKYVFGSDGALSVNSSTGIMGIDVSKWNGTIDWTAVKNSGVNYVIIRCGYRGSSTGALIQDPKFKANIQGASAAGIKVGVYFFTQAVNEVEAVEEASMVLNLVKGHKLSYPIFIDVESSGGRADGLDRNTRTAVVNAFCRTIQNGGYAAGIYANKTWFESKMNTSALSGYKIWLAQYAAAPTYKATRYDMWQYTSKGKVSGIKGDVDLNLSYLAY